jgi:hypothetical protein
VRCHDEADRERGMRGVRRLGERKLPNDAIAANRTHPTSKTQERGGSLPGFSIGVQKDILVAS